jgi:hypothetical protein
MFGREAQAFGFRPLGCDPASSCVAVRAIVLSIANVDPMPDGSLLYTCDVIIDRDADPGTYPIEILSTGVSSPQGEPIVSTGRNGTLAVQAATPTATQPSTATPTTGTQLGTPTGLVIATATRRPAADDDGGCAVSPEPTRCA